MKRALTNKTCNFSWSELVLIPTELIQEILLYLTTRDMAAFGITSESNFFIVAHYLTYIARPKEITFCDNKCCIASVFGRYCTLFLLYLFINLCLIFYRIETSFIGRLYLLSNQIHDNLVNMLVLSGSAYDFVHIIKPLLNDERVIPSTLDAAALIGTHTRNLSVLKLLISDDRVDFSSKKNEAILVACKNGSTEIVKLLLADPRTDPSIKNNLPLIEACKLGYHKIVSLLLKYFFLLYCSIHCFSASIFLVFSPLLAIQELIHALREIFQSVLPPRIIEQKVFFSFCHQSQSIFFFLLIFFCNDF